MFAFCKQSLEKYSRDKPFHIYWKGASFCRLRGKAKEKMVKIITSLSLLALTILFACLQSLWTPFSYFALTFGCALSLMWVILLLVDYFLYYKRENLKERYKVYCAMLVNTSALTLEIIQKNDKIYYKKFQKTLIKEKLLDWLKIIFVFGLFIALFFIFLR